MTQKKPPMTDIVKAAFQWLYVSIVLGFLCFLGLFVVPFTILTSKRQANFVGELEQAHSARYKAEGSSGQWEYRASNVPFLRWFSNLEDGDLGEPSGKYSASRGGDERSLASRYNWLALRNPVNMLKRTNPFFHCIVDECAIEWWGSRNVDDKGFNWGWQFVKATSLKTGKAYYGFRKAESLGEGWRWECDQWYNPFSYEKVPDGVLYCRQYRFGFKVKPGHANETQDADDKDKAFTLRAQLKSEQD